MRTKLSAETWADMEREGITLERYAAMLQESLEMILAIIERCTITDPELIDPDFAPAGTVSGSEWIDLWGLPRVKEP